MKTENRGCCWCGCGNEVAKTFKQGHDARFWGRVKKVQDGRLKLKDVLSEVEDYAAPLYRKAVKGQL